MKAPMMNWRVAMNNNTTDVLTPGHKLWPTFRKKLDDTITTYINNKLHNRCQGDLSNTIKILESLKNIDIKETIIFFQEMGGSCDCKVLMNVARIWRNK